MMLHSQTSVLFHCIAYSLILTLIADCAGDGSPKNISACYEADNPLQSFGIAKLKDVVSVGYVAYPSNADLVIITSPESSERFNCSLDFSALKPEGFSIKRMSGNKTAVISRDNTGAMYGLMDLAEQFQMGKSLSTIEEKTINPATEFRGIKFNLPWNSYRTDQSLQIHESTVRDLNYWKGFLDMMAENRFNALTLWSLHPFSYMIRAKNFPDACPWSDAELKNWQHFWHELFRMAADRGIRTYVFSWNIMVSPSFAEKYGLAEYCRDDYKEYPLVR